eukprot:SAG31_NODE_789_length_12087_cov_5.727227_5_plen_66_part_00
MPTKDGHAVLMIWPEAPHFERALKSGEGCYFLVFVQLLEKYGTLIVRNTTLIEKVSPCSVARTGR